MQSAVHEPWSLEHRRAMVFPVEPTLGTFPYVHASSGCVCFLVPIDGRFVTGFASALWLHRRFGDEGLRHGLLTAYKRNAEGIDAEVLRRVGAGGGAPVWLLHTEGLREEVIAMSQQAFQDALQP